MKYLSYLLIALLSLSFLSCKKEAQQLNGNYIPVNDCRSFTIAGKTLQLCLDSVVQDSRCPINAECIWQGVAVARFSAISENENQVITLATNKLMGYNQVMVVEGFRIEFIDLTPYTEINRPFNYSDYVAEVRITKQ